MAVAAIVTAAGSGTRLGHPLPKALVPLAGSPLVVHAVRRLQASGVVDTTVVAVPQDHAEQFAAVVEPLGARWVSGGPTRQASVARALASLPAGVDVVLVHDAARALTPASVVLRVVAAVRSGSVAVLPVVPVTDSVVDVSGGVRAVDRSWLRAVQTPQGFDRAVLDRAHDAARDRSGDERTAATDDASLCALVGAALTVVEGHGDALKITTPRDLALATLLVGDDRG